ncbi:MAG TPA: response regulator [Myxococcales bacterium]|nr:response regulator [Myxococcales bacterium]
MSRRILIVEDSDDVRQSYVPWFESAGYQVTEARDGQEALALSQREPPDVVLLDIGIPGIDGYTLASIWRRDPQMSRVPVVVLSGNTGDEHEERALKSGCTIALPKPCLPDMILAAVKGAVRA